jgi:hypothetical protein
VSKIIFYVSGVINSGFSLKLDGFGDFLKKIFKKINRLRELIVNIAEKEIMIILYCTKNSSMYCLIWGNYEKTNKNISLWMHSRDRQNSV